MRGRQIILVFLFSLLFLGFGFSYKTVESQTTINQPKRERTPVPNEPAEMESVSFDKEKTYLWCPFTPKSYQGVCTRDAMQVRVSTVATDLENDVLIYNYEVSGGRIIGQGANVIWDFSGLQPGVYEITVSVDDGCGHCGKSITRSFKFENCDVCDPIPPPCYCPSIDVKTLSQPIKKGDTIYFSADVKNAAVIEPVKYRWTISGGTIVEGQDTAEIKVKTDFAASEKTVAATVEIVEAKDLCADCPRTAAKTIEFTNR